MGKMSKAYNSEQISALLAAIAAIQQNLTTLMDDSDKTFKRFEGDEIMGDSEQKTPIIDGISQVRVCYNTIQEKSISMKAKADATATQLGEAIQANIKTNEEAAALIAAAAKKVTEGPGATV
jgi:hypothetical protein